MSEQQPMAEGAGPRTGRPGDGARGETVVYTPGATMGQTLAERGSVPGYEILATLGRGGMGVVYKARQVALNRIVALKMILAGSHAGERERLRFRIEAEAAARLQHPHIVQIHDIGEADGTPYISLEFVEGGSLAAQLQGALLPVRRAAEIVALLARAIHAAHQHDIVHRDLKPANILLTRDGQPKISDFGLCKKLDDDSAETQSGTIIGTPSYMAPEQAAGRTKDIGPATDVYALGAILYETLTGRAPFRAASALEPRGRLLSYARQDGLLLWDVATGRQLARLSSQPTRAALFDPKGGSLISWGSDGLKRWPIRESGGRLDLFPPRDLGVPGNSLVEWADQSDDGGILALGDRTNGQVIVFDPAAEKVIARCAHPNPSRLAVSPDGRWIAGGVWGEAGKVRIFDAATGRKVIEFPTSFPPEVTFSPDSRTLVIGTPAEYRFLQVGSWQPGRTITTQRTVVPSLAFSRDSRLLAYTLVPGATTLEDARTGAVLATFPGGDPLSFSRDSNQLVTRADDAIEVWDLRLLRTQLRDMGLDWDSSEPPPPPARVPGPLQVGLAPITVR